jgi:hypothetical protein
MFSFFNKDRIQFFVFLRFLDIIFSQRDKTRWNKIISQEDQFQFLNLEKK